LAQCRGAAARGSDHVDSKFHNAISMPQNLLLH
jgi:hypothetical protein